MVAVRLPPATTDRSLPADTCAPLSVVSLPLCIERLPPAEIALVSLVVLFASQWWSAFFVTDCDMVDCTASTVMSRPAVTCASPPAARFAPCTSRSRPADTTMSPVDAMVPCAPSRVVLTLLLPDTALTPTVSTSVVLTMSRPAITATRLPVIWPDALITSFVAETTVVPFVPLLPIVPPRFRMPVALTTVCVPPLITPEFVALPVAWISTSSATISAPVGCRSFACVCAR
ncbi:hypothetical protein R75465_08165 [Paraburkholderia aspalathi]|nr:hypothetical protein R75465_08165 [Paraburkholderia aspalathi]